MPRPYDDGGYSGGSMERPALRQLFADIAAHKVDVVVRSAPGLVIKSCH